VAIALTVGGVILLGVVLYDFVRGLGRDSFTGLVLELLSGLLLVFIFTELISTIRVAIARRSVTVEPFLIVGMVPPIRGPARRLAVRASSNDRATAAREEMPGLRNM
jgi:CDP-diglyceride synthetase